MKAKPRIKPGAEMVAAEIAKLRGLQDAVEVSPHGFFKVWQMSAQLDVLADTMDEAEIREMFGEEENLLRPALAAFRWLNGEMDAPKPSAAYTDLLTAETR